MPETALDLLNMKSLFEFLLKRFLPKVHRQISLGSTLPAGSATQSSRFTMSIFNLLLHIFKQIHQKMKRIKQIDPIPSNPKMAT